MNYLLRFGSVHLDPYACLEISAWNACWELPLCDSVPRCMRIPQRLPVYLWKKVFGLPVYQTSTFTYLVITAILSHTNYTYLACQMLKLSKKKRKKKFNRCFKSQIIRQIKRCKIWISFALPLCFFIAFQSLCHPKPGHWIAYKLTLFAWRGICIH